MSHHLSNVLGKPINQGYHKLKRQNIFTDIGISLRKRSFAYDDRSFKYNRTSSNIWNIPREASSKMALCKIIQNSVPKKKSNVQGEINKCVRIPFFKNDYINSAINITNFDLDKLKEKVKENKMRLLSKLKLMFSDKNRALLKNKEGKTKENKWNARRCSDVNKIKESFRPKIRDSKFETNLGENHNKRINRLFISKISNSTEMLKMASIKMKGTILAAKETSPKYRNNEFPNHNINKTNNQLVFKNMQVLGEHIKLR